jgi:hypothetical protein
MIRLYVYEIEFTDTMQRHRTMGMSFGRIDAAPQGTKVTLLYAIKVTSLDLAKAPKRDRECWLSYGDFEERDHRQSAIGSERQ